MDEVIWLYLPNKRSLAEAYQAIWGANCFFNTLVLKFIIYHLAQLGKKLAMKLYAHSVQCV